jgi:hypothetical protein
MKTTPQIAPKQSHNLSTIARLYEYRHSHALPSIPLFRLNRNAFAALPRCKVVYLALTSTLIYNRLCAYSTPRCVNAASKRSRRLVHPAEIMHALATCRLVCFFCTCPSEVEIEDEGLDVPHWPFEALAVSVGLLCGARFLPSASWQPRFGL